MHHFKPKRLHTHTIMSSTPVSSPIKASTPSAPVKAAKKVTKTKEPVTEPEQKQKQKVKKEPTSKEPAHAPAPAAPEPEQKQKQKAKKEPKQKVDDAAAEAAATDAEPSSKKPRSTGLPAKYGKFIQYSYYLIRAINNHSLQTNGTVLIDEDQFFNAAHVFDTASTQQDFVSAFLENKGIAKEMRMHVADKEKAAKAAAKEAEKAAKLDAKNAEKLAKTEAKKATKLPKEPKTTKATKSKKATVEPDLVTSLVALANSNGDTTPAQATDNVSAAPPAEEEEEEEELDVRLITIHGKEFLIDDANNIYDSKSHSLVGTWNKDKDVIVQP